MFRTCCNRRRGGTTRISGAGAAGSVRLGARRQRGFTLIEVLVALVLTSILVLGLSGLWANVGHQFLFLTLKQKAVFVLNGEMERLSALYRFTNFGGEQVSYTVAQPDYCSVAPNDRFIYPNAGGPPVVDDIVTTSDIDFDCGENACAGRVLYFNGTLPADDRNYAWIDQDRDVTAELSWCLQPPRGVAAAGYGSCSDGGAAGDDSVTPAVIGGEADCQELTVFLEFPFRYNDVANPAADAGKTETLTLVTIVGRRQ